MMSFSPGEGSFLAGDGAGWRLGCSCIVPIEACDCAREILGLEGLEVLNAFAHADGIDRQREAIGDGDENAAARAAVELGDNEAGHPGDLAEDLDLVQRVLPRGGIEHEDDAM